MTMREMKPIDDNDLVSADAVDGKMNIDDEEEDGKDNTTKGVSIAAASAAMSELAEPAEGGLRFPLHPQHMTYTCKSVLAAPRHGVGLPCVH